MTLPVALGADWVDLWPGEAPGAKRPKVGTETTGGGWRFSNIEVPQYTLFKAEKPNGTGVVVLPGGGYAMLAADHEGKQVGEFFAKRGVTAIVVKYRVSGNAALGYQFPVPQMDARRARFLRKALDQHLDFLADGNHQIGQLVNQHDKVRHPFRDLLVALPVLNTKTKSCVS